MFMSSVLDHLSDCALVTGDWSDIPIIGPLNVRIVRSWFRISKDDILGLHPVSATCSLFRNNRKIYHAKCHMNSGRSWCWIDLERLLVDQTLDVLDDDFRLCYSPA